MKSLRVVERAVSFSLAASIDVPIDAIQENAPNAPYLSYVKMLKV
jgi:hypothetical protein